MEITFAAPCFPLSSKYALMSTASSLEQKGAFIMARRFARPPGAKVRPAEVAPQEREVALWETWRRPPIDHVPARWRHRIHPELLPPPDRLQSFRAVLLVLWRTVREWTKLAGLTEEARIPTLRSAPAVPEKEIF